jgi:hypothetical protein
VATAPLSASTKELEGLYSLLSNLSQETAVILPEGYQLDFANPSGSPDVFKNLIDYIDKEISVLICGEDEAGQALPVGLPHDAESPACHGRIMHRGMTGAGTTDRLEVVIEGEVMTDSLLADPPVVEELALLAEEQGFRSDAAGIAFLQRCPVEGLAALQSHPEIELRTLHHPRGSGIHPHRAK